MPSFSSGSSRFLSLQSLTTSKVPAIPKIILKVFICLYLIVTYDSPARILDQSFVFDQRFFSDRPEIIALLKGLIIQGLYLVIGLSFLFLDIPALNGGIYDLFSLLPSAQIPKPMPFESHFYVPLDRKSTRLNS